MCFIRLSVPGLASHRVETMLHIWKDWPALRGQTARRRIRPQLIRVEGRGRLRTVAV